MQEHLRAWLADPQGRDQYVTYRGDEVKIHWHGKPSQCEMAHKPVRLDFRYAFGSLTRVLGLEGLLICCMVSSWHLHCHTPSPRGSVMGRPIMETPTAVCTSICKTHRFFTMRELPCYLVK